MLSSFLLMSLAGSTISIVWTSQNKFGSVPYYINFFLSLVSVVFVFLGICPFRRCYLLCWYMAIQWYRLCILYPKCWGPQVFHILEFFWILEYLYKPYWLSTLIRNLDFQVKAVQFVFSCYSFYFYKVNVSFHPNLLLILYEWVNLYCKLIICKLHIINTVTCFISCRA